MSAVEQLADPEFKEWLKRKATKEERARYAPFLHEMNARAEIERDWKPWVKGMFPRHVTAEFADYQESMWEWWWELRPNIRPEPFIGVIFRGGAKSTGAEMGVVVAGATERRRYFAYVCRIQDQADEHVANIGNLLESPEIAAAYPKMSERKLGKFGNSQGWRGNRLRTASGVTVDAIGLDKAKRGAKVEEERPGCIVLDDIDKHDDSPRTVRKLIKQITKAIIPMGSPDCALIFVQNLIHANGVMAKIISGVADFLRRRRVIGPIPAITEMGIDRNADGTLALSGVATWEGFNLTAAEALLNDIGEQAFREECQHEVERVVGALWSREQVAAMRVSEHPDLTYIDIGVDPSGGEGPDNDEQGIITCGYGEDGYLYVLADNSGHYSPNGWGNTSVRCFERWDADMIIGEQNYGGDMVKSTVENAAVRLDIKIKYDDVTATRGKARRIGPVAAECGDPQEPESWAFSRVKLVGSFPELEDEMCTWVPDESNWSPNRLDGLAWCATYRMLAKKKRPRASYRRDEADELLEMMEMMDD